MTFVDTGGWYSNAVPDDANYPMATAWFTANRSRLFTTNYVIDETLTLLRSRGYTLAAIRLGSLFFNESIAEIYCVTEEDEYAAWTIFSTYSDKAWSFTDCTSKVGMERLNIKTALSFDQHFRQFGTVQVVP